MPVGDNAAQFEARVLNYPENHINFESRVLDQPNNTEQFYSYVTSHPPLPSGPIWAGVNGGVMTWMPGLIWDGTQFVRYRMWDGNNWQISEGHDPDVAL